MRVYLAQRNIKDFSRRDSQRRVFIFLSVQKDEEILYNKILNLKKRNSKQLPTFKTNLFLYIYTRITVRAAYYENTIL